MPFFHSSHEGQSVLTKKKNQNHIAILISECNVEITAGLENRDSLQSRTFIISGVKSSGSCRLPNRGKLLAVKSYFYTSDLKTQLYRVVEK